MDTERLRLKQELVQQWLEHQVTKAQVAQQLRVSLRTIERYRQRFLRDGPAGLQSRHTIHYRKLTRADELRIVQAKKQGRHRSARWVRDHLTLRVHETTVWRLFVKHDLNRLTMPPNPADARAGVDLKGPLLVTSHLSSEDWLHCFALFNERSPTTQKDGPFG